MGRNKGSFVAILSQGLGISEVADGHFKSAVKMDSLEVE